MCGGWGEWINHRSKEVGRERQKKRGREGVAKATFGPQAGPEYEVCAHGEGGVWGPSITSNDTLRTTGNTQANAAC